MALIAVVALVALFACAALAALVGCTALAATADAATAATTATAAATAAAARRLPCRVVSVCLTALGVRPPSPLRPCLLASLSQPVLFQGVALPLALQQL